MNTYDDIKLPPNPARIMEGLRDTGYDFNTAVADIIDNSIAAGAGLVNVDISQDPMGDITIYIADDGCGMTYDELVNAMCYGSSERSDPASLGKFGLGLKTASTAFCRCLSVISRGADNKVNKLQWDIDYIVEKNDWNLRRMDPDSDEIYYLDQTAGSSNTGTLVVWEHVDRLLQGDNAKNTSEKALLKKTIEQLEFHISMVYQRFLDNNDKRASDVIINLNGKRIRAWDPFCTSEENTRLLYDKDIPIEIVGREESEYPELQIKAYLIPRRDEFSTIAAATAAKVSSDMQGFYIYRENRLIYYADWMGMYQKEPHGTLLRVEMSFTHELDDVFHIDIKKSKITPTDSIYVFIRDNILPPLRREADDRYRKGTRKAVEKGSQGAHDAADRSIDEKAAGIQESQIKVVDKKTGAVDITNNSGTFRNHIVIHESQEDNKQKRIIPVESIDDGLLWRPCITSDGEHAVEINMSHPFYQKIYSQIIQQNVLVTGLDSLLWVLGEGELSTVNERTKEQFEDVRAYVSRGLKKLVADLPDPEEGLDE